MSGGANRSVSDERQRARHPIDHRVSGEHRQRGDVSLHVVNISAHGFMVRGATQAVQVERRPR